jgi:hypothetical protein
MRIWSAESPREFVETLLYLQKIGVCLAVSRRGIIGSIFFNQTAARYHNDLLQRDQKGLFELAVLIFTFKWYNWSNFRLLTTSH